MATFDHQKTYASQVRRQYLRIAQIIQAIIASHVTSDGRIDDQRELNAQLERYGVSLTSWAQEFWGNLLTKQVRVLNADFKKQGITLPQRSAVLNAQVAALQAEQVRLIRTLPSDAAAEAQSIAEKASLSTGDRAQSLIRRLQGLEPGYPEFAARRLARTEIAKSQAILVRTQAQSVGITHYVWRTMSDGNVRDQHAALNGQIFAYDDPPEIEGEGRHGPGEIWNCRCYGQPIIPGVDAGADGGDGGDGGE